MRSIERTVEEVLLPGVEAMAADGGDTGPEYGFGWRWATGWLAASMRFAPAATRADGVLIFDASRPIDMDSLHAQALELVLRRGGLRTLTLTTELDPDRLAHALHALDPRAVVLTGRRASLDTLGRLVFAARRVGGDRVLVFDYRGALPETGASTVERLGDKPIAARDLLVDHLERRARGARRRPRDALSGRKSWLRAGSSRRPARPP